MDRRAVLVVLLAALAAVVLVVWRWDLLRPSPDGGERAPPESEPAATRTVEAPGAVETPAQLEGRDVLATAPAETLPAGPRVTGLVLDAAGDPVAGARVVAVGDTNGKPFPAERAGTKDVPGFAATTDPEGRFAVPVSSDAPLHFLLAHAERRGFGGKGNVPAGADVTLRLEPALALVGTVKDREEAPVVGARVRATLLLDTLEVAREAVSGEGGAYRIEDLPGPVYRPTRAWPGYHVATWFEVTAHGFAPLAVENVLAAAKPPEHRQDFTLSRGATLVGRVEDAETGAAIEGATVALHSVEGMMGYQRMGAAPYSTPWAPRPLARTTSAKDGSFTTLHVPCTGPHGSASHNFARRGGPTLGGVAAWAPGYAAGAQTVDMPADGERVEIALRLWPSAMLTGRIVEKDGTPAAEVGVNARVEGRAVEGWIPPLYEDAPRSHASAGDDGRFRLDGVPAVRGRPTEVTLLLYRTRRDPRAASRQGDDGSSKASVRAGDTLDVGDLVVEPQEILATTTIVVTAPDGRPVFGAAVGRGAFSPAQRRTDEDGRIEWVWARPREGSPPAEVPALVSATGFAPTPVVLFAPGSGHDEVRVTMLPAHRLAGRVLEEDGSPAAGRAVTVGDGSASPSDVFPEGKREFELRIGEIPRGRSTPLVHMTTWTDDAGRFAFEDLPEGPYHVQATKPRRVATATRTPALRTIVSGVASDATDVILRLPPDDSPPTGTLAGSVTEGGKPLATAGVSVMRGDTYVAGAGGRTSGMGPPPAPGMPRVQDSGEFSIADLPVGTYTVRVQSPGLRTASLEGVEIRAGETTRIGTVELDRGVTVVGRATAPVGMSVRDRVVILRTPGRREFGTAPVEPDGSFRVSGLSAGRWHAVLQSLRFTEDPQDAPLIPSRGETLGIGPEDREVRFDVAWAAGGMLGIAPADDRLPPAPSSGRTATPEQERFGRASRAVLRGPSGEVLLDVTGLFQHQSAPDGWLTLLPGRYQARLELPGGEVREESVEVVAGKTARVQFARK